MKTLAEKMEEAAQLESAGNLGAAEKLYLQTIKPGILNTPAISRLLVIYRKQKAYSKELALVRNAIKTFEDNLAAIRNKWSSTHKKAAGISRALANSLGMLSRKGLPVNEDPQLARWRKRKERLEKLIRKMKG